MIKTSANHEAVSRSNERPGFIAGAYSTAPAIPMSESLASRKGFMNIRQNYRSGEAAAPGKPAVASGSGMMAMSMGQHSFSKFNN